MTGLSSSSNESFIKSQESLVQSAKCTPKPINILQTQFDNIINKYNATENAKINRKPIILLNEEKYENSSKVTNSNSKLKKEARKRRSRKTERKLDVEEHDRALNEIKKIASIMDSNNTINKKGHSRKDDDDDDYCIFIGHSSSSENSSKSNSSYTINSSKNESVTNHSGKLHDNLDEANNSNNSIAFVISPNSESSLCLNTNNIINRDQQKLVIPNAPTPIFNNLSVSNLRKDVFFSKEDVFKKTINIDDDAQSNDSKKEEEDEEKRLNDKKKKSKLKQFLKLHKENCLLEMPNALYSDIIAESIKILTKTSQNYTSQLGKKDESTIGSIKHLEHLKEMIPTGNQFQQHIDNNSGKYGPGYYQLCAPIDENGQYVQLKEKVLINSLESLNSVK